MADNRQEARRIIVELARAVDRKLAVEVRDVPGQERLHVSLTHGLHQAQIEVAMPAVLAEIPIGVLAGMIAKTIFAISSDRPKLLKTAEKVPLAGHWQVC